MEEGAIRELLQSVIGKSVADNVEVYWNEFTENSTRFANNGITQNVSKSEITLSVKVAFGNHVGMVRTTTLEEEGLRDAVARAEALAKASDPDTEYMPPPEPQSYPDVKDYDDRTANATPQDRANIVRKVIERAEAAGVQAAGSTSSGHSAYAVSNNKGLFATHRSSSSHLVVTAMTPTSSGWAAAESHKLVDGETERVVQRAIGKAQLAQDPKPYDPRPVTVILEPSALAELLSFFGYSLDAKAADEGRSSMSGKLDTRLGADFLHISSQPAHPEAPGSPFFHDGMAVPTVNWIEGGVLRNLSTSRFWAQKTSRPFTGHPTNLIMHGDSKTLDDLIASTADGLLITRFWYIRFVDPMKMLLTGMTRDGLYEIKDGKIVGGVKNLRFNDSPLRLFQHLVEMGVPERASGYPPAMVPPVKAEEFTFTSATQF